MCGIVGYIGSSPASNILVDGLRRLEYRGYDSAGLAFINGADFEIVRAPGKLSELVKKIQGKNLPATQGIGHTRWATHGKPSENNAHPHHSRDVALVHNGIIENYLALKDKLVKKGHKVVSETDSEIIAHLVQDYLDGGKKFNDALYAALADLRGAFSLVLMHRQDKNRIYAVKKGSPLVVGIGGGENLVASDVPALLSYTQEMIFLEDGEVACLEREQVTFTDFTGKPKEKQSRRINWTAAQAEKGGYKHFMLKEIMEEPRVFADTFLGRIDQAALSVTLGDADAFIKDYATQKDASIHIIACGTSYHSGLVGAYWLEALARVPVKVELASEFRYRTPLLTPQTLVIAISQSGETADTIASLAEARKCGAKILAICNVVESSIPRQADATIYTHAGPEIGVASTKAFLTQMEVLYFLSLRLAGLKKSLTDSEIAVRVQALIELPILMQKTIALAPDILDVSEKIYRQHNCYFLGRGMQYPIALEGALKLKEISYIHAEGYAGGEMKHGPIALIEEDVPVVALLPRDGLHEKMLSNVEEVRARGASIIAITTGDDAHLDKNCLAVIRIPETHPDLLPFLTVLPLQLLSYHCADLKGTDVDQPRNLAKSVTVE